MLNGTPRSYRDNFAHDRGHNPGGDDERESRDAAALHRQVRQDQLLKMLEEQNYADIQERFASDIEDRYDAHVDPQQIYASCLSVAALVSSSSPTSSVDKEKWKTIVSEPLAAESLSKTAKRTEAKDVVSEEIGQPGQFNPSWRIWSESQAPAGFPMREPSSALERTLPFVDGLSPRFHPSSPHRWRGNMPASHPSSPHSGRGNMPANAAHGLHTLQRLGGMSARLASPRSPRSPAQTSPAECERAFEYGGASSPEDSTTQRQALLIREELADSAMTLAKNLADSTAITEQILTETVAELKRDLQRYAEQVMDQGMAKVHQELAFVADRLRQDLGLPPDRHALLTMETLIEKVRQLEDNYAAVAFGASWHAPKEAEQVKSELSTPTSTLYATPGLQNAWATRAADDAAKETAPSAQLPEGLGDVRQELARMTSIVAQCASSSANAAAASARAIHETEANLIRSEVSALRRQFVELRARTEKGGRMEMGGSASDGGLLQEMCESWHKDLTKKHAELAAVYSNLRNEVSALARKLPDSLRTYDRTQPKTSSDMVPTFLKGASSSAPAFPKRPPPADGCEWQSLRQELAELDASLKESLARHEAFVTSKLQHHEFQLENTSGAPKEDGLEWRTVRQELTALDASMRESLARTEEFVMSSLQCQGSPHVQTKIASGEEEGFDRMMGHHHLADSSDRVPQPIPATSTLREHHSFVENPTLASKEKARRKQKSTARPRALREEFGQSSALEPELAGVGYECGRQSTLSRRSSAQSMEREAGPNELDGLCEDLRKAVDSALTMKTGMQELVHDIEDLRRDTKERELSDERQSQEMAQWRDALSELMQQRPEQKEDSLSLTIMREELAEIDERVNESLERQEAFMLERLQQHEASFAEKDSSKDDFRRLQKDFARFKSSVWDELGESSALEQELFGLREEASMQNVETQVVASQFAAVRDDLKQAVEVAVMMQIGMEDVAQEIEDLRNDTKAEQTQEMAHLFNELEQQQSTKDLRLELAELDENVSQSLARQEAVVTNHVQHHEASLAHVEEAMKQDFGRVQKDLARFKVGQQDDHNRKLENEIARLRTSFVDDFGTVRDDLQQAVETALMMKLAMQEFAHEVEDLRGDIQEQGLQHSQECLRMETVRQEVAELDQDVKESLVRHESFVEEAMEASRKDNVDWQAVRLELVELDNKLKDSLARRTVPDHGEEALDWQIIRQELAEVDANVKESLARHEAIVAESLHHTRESPRKDFVSWQKLRQELVEQGGSCSEASEVCAAISSPEQALHSSSASERRIDPHKALAESCAQRSPAQSVEVSAFASMFAALRGDLKQAVETASFMKNGMQELSEEIEDLRKDIKEKELHGEEQSLEMAQWRDMFNEWKQSAADNKSAVSESKTQDCTEKGISDESKPHERAQEHVKDGSPEQAAEERKDESNEKSAPSVRSEQPVDAEQNPDFAKKAKAGGASFTVVAAAGKFLNMRNKKTKDSENR